MRSHSNGGGRAEHVTARPLRFCVFVYSFEKWNSALARKKLIVLGDEGGALTAAGRRFLTEFGVVLTPATGQRIFCRPAWTGASGHITSSAISAPSSAVSALSAAGSRDNAGRARYASLRPAGAGSSRVSA